MKPTAKKLLSFRNAAKVLAHRARAHVQDDKNRVEQQRIEKAGDDPDDGEQWDFWHDYMAFKD